MSTRNKKRARKQNKRRSHASGSKRIISMMVMVVVLALVYSASSSYAKNQDYIEQEIELMAQLEEEQNRAAEIEELKDYSETDEYIEQVAREKLGMAYEDEVIFEAAQ